LALVVLLKTRIAILNCKIAFFRYEKHSSSCRKLFFLKYNVADDLYTYIRFLLSVKFYASYIHRLNQLNQMPNNSTYFFCNTLLLMSFSCIVCVCRFQYPDLIPPVCRGNQPSLLRSRGCRISAENG
jgi:hypothetical protein